MSYLKKLSIAMALVVAPIAATAAPLTPGIYNVDDIDFNGNVRSIWTPNGNSGPNGNALVTGTDVSAYWKFNDVVLNYGGTGAMSTMTGTAENLGQSELKLDIDLKFGVATAPGAQTGYCQFGGGGGGSCGVSNPVDDDWAFMTILAGSTFSGVENSVLDGIEWKITDRSNGNHPPQVGIDANALVQNGLQDISFWFDFMQTSGGNSATGVTTYSIKSNGYGDVNSHLSAVPVPATGLLLIGALGLGAFAGRRRKT